MKHLSMCVAALGLCVAGCGSSMPAGPTSPPNPTFTAALMPANEVPPIVNAESTGSGTATITFVTTKDGSGNITAATATFAVNLTGFPPGTPINIAHIHPGAVGINGAVLVSTNLTAGEVTLTNGSGSFTKSGISVDPAVAQSIIGNPAAFYFNVHSTLNPGGVARGQLVRTQ